MHSSYSELFLWTGFEKQIRRLNLIIHWERSELVGEFQSILNAQVRLSERLTSSGILQSFMSLFGFM